MRKFIFAIGIGLSQLLCQAHAVMVDYYDEVMDGSEFRASYLEHMDMFGLKFLNPSRETQSQLLNKPLGDLIQVLPIPLILDSAENTQIIDKGINRLQILSEMFHLVVTKKITLDPAARFALESEGWRLEDLNKMYAGKTPEDIRVLYGPDLTRNRKGEWFVLEDNIGGNLGGKADLKAIHSRFHKLHEGGALKSSFLQEDFVVSAVSVFLRDIGYTQSRAQKALVIFDGTRDRQDNEDQRTLKALKRFNFDFVEPDFFALKDSPAQNDLMERIRSGYYTAIINLDEPHLNYSELVEFYTHILQKTSTQLFISPGVNMIGSKMMVTTLGTSHSLGRPILRSPKSIFIWDSIPDEVLKNPYQWVVKPVDGLQGRNVTVFKYKSKSELENAIRDLHKIPVTFSDGTEGFVYNSIAQKFVSGSVIYNPMEPDKKFQIDLRPMFYASGKSFYASDVPWGRAVPANQGKLTNVSQGAQELVVLITRPEKKKPRGTVRMNSASTRSLLCPQIFRK